MVAEAKGRCGLCCSLTVRISPADIARIRQLGFKEDYFVETTSRGEKVLRRINSYCRFLELKDGIASCAIYPSRPKVCREYECIKPGEEDCTLKHHYSLVDIGDLDSKKDTR